MGRSPCCEKSHTNKGAWTKEEDKLLIDYIRKHGEGSWRSLPTSAGLPRCGKSCRLRWINYLRPGLKRGNFTQQEDQLIIDLHTLLGNKWSLIAGRLPGRTHNEIKNYWNTHITRKLGTQTHSGITNITSLNNIFTCEYTKPKTESNKTSSSGMTTTDHEDPYTITHQREDEEEVNLELGIGIGPTRIESTTTHNSAESKLRNYNYPVLQMPRAVCLCCRLGGDRIQMCPNCHLQPTMAWPIGD